MLRRIQQDESWTLNPLCTQTSAVESLGTIHLQLAYSKKK